MLVPGRQKGVAENGIRIFAHQNFFPIAIRPPFRSNPSEASLALNKAEEGQEKLPPDLNWTAWEDRDTPPPLLAFYTTNLRQMCLCWKQVSRSSNNSLYGIGTQMEPEETQIQGQKEQKNN